MLGAMSDDRLIAVIYLLCVLLWVGSSQFRDAQMQAWARRGAWLLLAVGTFYALFRMALWLAGQR